MQELVCVIGAGASGLMAAIAAARAGAGVLLLERKDSPGRKLLATGNGRCNFSNRDLSLDHFHGDAEFIAKVLGQFDGRRTLEFFREIGLESVCDERGRYFPASDEASAVLFCLMREVERLGVRMKTRSEAVTIKRTRKGFAISERGASLEAGAVIIACGGMAAAQFGSNGGGYELARQLGHASTPTRPGLTPIELAGPWFHKLQGVRLDMMLTISRGGRVAQQITDEGLFTKYGLSGPLALRASRSIGEGDVDLLLNFLPHWGGDGAALAMVKARAAMLSSRCAGDLLTGLLPAKAGAVIVRESGISHELPCGRLTDEQLERLAAELTRRPIMARGLRPFKEAQVTVGGVVSSGIDPSTMGSRAAPGAFFCGEVTDVDGDSGGYNLQWAWSSGYVAGRAAAAFMSGT